MADGLARAQVIQMVKGIASEAAEAEAVQLSLFGVPPVLAVPDDNGGYVYLRAAASRWPDLVAARAVRAANISNAQAKLDALAALMERVQPVMEGTSVPLAEAIMRLEAGDEH